MMDTEYSAVILARGNPRLKNTFAASGFSNHRHDHTQARVHAEKKWFSFFEHKNLQYRVWRKSFLVMSAYAAAIMPGLRKGGDPFGPVSLLHVAIPMITGAMKMEKREALSGIFRRWPMSMGLCAMLAFSGLAQAQKPSGLPGNYPSKLVRVLIPVVPGGGTDTLSRLVFGRLGDIWGTPFVSENVPAAGGMVAMEQLRRAPADGHLLGFVSSSTYIRAAFVAPVDWDVRKEFAPVAPVSLSTLLLAVSNNQPFRNLKELIAYAKANPGKLSYGASEVGGSPHLTAERIWHEAGIKLVHIPYKGTGQAVIDTIGGRVPVLMGSVAALTPHVKAGKLTLIGVTSGERVDSAPDFQTIAEAGLTGFDYTGWFGVVAPANTPPAVVNALNKSITDILRMPEVKAAMLKSGADQMIGTPEQFRKTILGSLDRTTEVLKATGLDLREK